MSTGRRVVVALAATRHYDLLAAGSTVEEAHRALLDRWTRHASAAGADPNLMRQMIDAGEVNVYALEPGQAIIE